MTLCGERGQRADARAGRMRDRRRMWNEIIEISEVARLAFLWLLSKSSQSLNHEVVNQMCLSQPLEQAKPQNSCD